MENSEQNLKQCPNCKEYIKLEAVKCRFCKEWLDKDYANRSEPVENIGLKESFEDLSSVLNCLTQSDSGQEINENISTIEENQQIKTVICSYCGEENTAESRKCKHCKKSLRSTAENSMDVKPIVRNSSDDSDFESIVLRCFANAVIIISITTGIVIAYKNQLLNETTILIMGAFFLIAGLYLLPAIVASHRGHNSAVSILVINIFLGWSFIGWVVALAWACSGDIKSKV